MSALRLLLADDHATVREALRMICDAQPDMEVVGEAANGEEAVEWRRRLMPDIVLMDVSMPRINGVRADVLRKRSPPVSPDPDAPHRRKLPARAIARRGGGLCPEAKPLGRTAPRHPRRRLGPQVPRPGGSGNLGRTSPRRGAEGGLSLSDRETEVLRLIAWGHSNKDIAARMDISVKTVEVHKANGMNKLGIRSRMSSAGSGCGNLHLIVPVAL